MIRRSLLLGLLALALVPACGAAEAAPGSAPRTTIKRAPNSPYTVGVVPLGDSITYGVGSSTAAWRTTVYNLSQATTDRKVFFWGSQVFAGGDSSMAADPYNEAHPGYVVKAGPSQTPPDSFGSLTDGSSSNFVADHDASIAILAGGTNDLASGVMNDSAVGTIASISTWLDVVWSKRTSPRYQIVLCEILKRLDADDAKVQVVNAALPATIAGKSYAANVTLVPMYNAITRQVVGQGYNDAVHPNGEGYVDMGNWMWTHGLQTAIRKSNGLTAP